MGCIPPWRPACIPGTTAPSAVLGPTAAPNEMAFWRILRQRTGVTAAMADPYLQPRRLTLKQTQEVSDERGKGTSAFKVGGLPAWSQDPESGLIVADHCEH